MEKREMRVNEIFSDIQGESSYAGYPFVFVRMSGCNLNCTYCDTDHNNFIEMDTDRIIKMVLLHKHKYILITGGEPLLQNITDLCRGLALEGKKILIETNGTQSFKSVLPYGTTIIFDVKCPSSGEKSNLDLIKHLRTIDEVKFVIGDRKDYDYAKSLLKNIHCYQIHFSPVWGFLRPGVLGNWILSDKLNVRLHLQQHKCIKILTDGCGYLGPCISHKDGLKIINYTEMDKK